MVDLIRPFVVIKDKSDDIETIEIKFFVRIT